MEEFLGWDEIRGNRTGFFHLENMEGRDWIVDPEGNVFLSIGINHVSPDLLFREYNRKESEKTYGKVPDPFDFEKFKQSQGWKKWLDTLRNDFQEMGFNTLGGLSSSEARPPDLPYTINIYFAPICHWTPVPLISFPDVFSQEFENSCDTLARRLCEPLHEDRMLLGYFYVDCPILTQQSASPKHGNLYWDMVRGQTPLWPSTIKSLRGPQAGKKVYVELMKKRYTDIRNFNRTYGTNCESFSVLYLRDMSEVIPEDKLKADADDDALLALILQQYYRATHTAICRYDPNHLILGDRYNGNTHIPDAAIEAMKPYVDVLSVQYYGTYDNQKNDLKQWHRASGKPILLCDSCFSVIDENLPNPFGYHVTSQENRARAYDDYAQSVFSLPYIVGWHWCGYIDQWTVAQGKRQHSGIKDAFGNPHQPLGQTMQRVNRELYGIHCQW